LKQANGQGIIVWGRGAMTRAGRCTGPISMCFRHKSRPTGR
jgi:hypothetical protein